MTAFETETNETESKPTRQYVRVGVEVRPRPEHECETRHCSSVRNLKNLRVDRCSALPAGCARKKQAPCQLREARSFSRRAISDVDAMVTVRKYAQIDLPSSSLPLGNTRRGIGSRARARSERSVDLRPKWRLPTSRWSGCSNAERLRPDGSRITSFFAWVCVVTHTKRLASR